MGCGASAGIPDPATCISDSGADPGTGSEPSVADLFGSSDQGDNWSNVQLHGSKEEEWRLVMRQTVGKGSVWWQKDAYVVNSEDPTAPNFAVLDELEGHRGADGKFHFKLVWPESGLLDQEWRQRTNPYMTRAPGVEGYEPVSCIHTGEYWGGLEAGHESTLLNGSALSRASAEPWKWWYAIGAYRGLGDLIPGPSRKTVKQVELYVAIEGSVAVPVQKSHKVCIGSIVLLSGHSVNVVDEESICDLRARIGNTVGAASVDILLICGSDKLADDALVEASGESIVTVIIRNWILMMRQTVGEGLDWWPQDTYLLNTNDSHAFNFAVLDQLEEHRSADGKLCLKLVWPDSGLPDQVWKQHTNPFLTRGGGVEGYESISCPHVGQYWGGLEAGHTSTLLHGSTKARASPEPWKWWYAIGVYTGIGNLIPGPGGRNSGANGELVKKVELYVSSA